jgi:hypothetical protein
VFDLLYNTNKPQNNSTLDSALSGVFRKKGKNLFIIEDTTSGKSERQSDE